jgi:hypothetical protein
MDITFLLLRWLVIFTGYFLLGLSIGSVVSYAWIVWREKKIHKELMKEILSNRK